MAIKTRLLKVEKDKSLSKITYGKRDIWWFFQWLKLALDYEGKTIEFGKSKKFTSGKRYGSATGTIKHKVKFTSWKQINLKEIKSSKPILKMTDKERFNFLNKMFSKYTHLFGDFTIRYLKTPKDFIQDDNYFTVQIPISKNRVEIDTELEKLRQVNKIPNVEKKREINFHRGIKHNEMKRLFEVFKLKESTNLENQIIAKRVGYKTGVYKMKNQNQTAGVRQVQIAYVSAKRLILNIAKGHFPKNTI
tara:strand:+ start:605 stop:1348 length:744 start_codon:yes stop_codon:yes gene_type:complete